MELSGGGKTHNCIVWSPFMHHCFHENIITLIILFVFRGTQHLLWCSCKMRPHNIFFQKVLSLTYKPWAQSDSLHWDLILPTMCGTRPLEISLQQGQQDSQQCGSFSLSSAGVRRTMRSFGSEMVAFISFHVCLSLAAFTQQIFPRKT